MHFQIEILSVKSLPANTNNKMIFVTWRRGSKKKNSGHSLKAMCVNGVADWPSSSSSLRLFLLFL